MSYCPLISFAKQYSTEVPCMGEECGFADEAGECLIKQALQCYVTKERHRIAIEETYVPRALDFMPALIEHKLKEKNNGD